MCGTDKDREKLEKRKQRKSERKTKKRVGIKTNENAAFFVLEKVLLFFFLKGPFNFFVASEKQQKLLLSMPHLAKCLRKKLQFC